MSTAPLTLTDTGKKTIHGDAVLTVDGATEGTIAVGYQRHRRLDGETWYLAIHLAPRLHDALGALPPTRIVIDGIERFGGVVIHQVDPPLPAWPEHYDLAGPLPLPDGTHDASLAPLVEAVLQQWHSPARLAASRAAASQSSPEPRDNRPR